MEYIYIRNVTLQNVKLIKDAYGTLVWKTHLKDLSYKERIWKTHVEDSSRRLISKTPFIKIIKDAYGTLVWKTQVEDSSQRLLL